LRIHHVHRIESIDRNAPWSAELSIACADRAPGKDEVAESVELLDAIVAGIGRVDVSGAVKRNA